MELFPDRAHVRLRSRVHGAYLHADEDGVGVSLSGRRETLNTVWAVHRVQRRRKNYLLLHSAAYGRYLALSPGHLRHTGCGAVQCGYFNDFDQRDIMWVATRKPDGDVFICNRAFGPWYSPDGFTTMAWVVEGVPSRGVPPLLPDVFTPFCVPMQQDPPVFWFRRFILYMQGDDYRNIDFQNARVLVFDGQSVSQLREELAERLEEMHPVRVTMCIWAGSYGRLTPLITDLPSNHETIEVVMFESWSPAALELVYPDVDA
ncbi:unnamed protein product [Urochloa decumbens]|uniref:DUF569 domain-containing protein n=1 Tax=Urochloa decumbens TaxID=240449 RepID=A0ABC9E603_9POAL